MAPTSHLPTANYLRAFPPVFRVPPFPCYASRAMLYVFYGSETFQRKEALDALRKELDIDGMLDTNTLVLQARQASPQEVIAACSAAPFLGGRRLVIVEGLLQEAQGGARRGRKKAAGAGGGPGLWQALAEFIPHMPETTALVILDGDVPADNPLLAPMRPAATVREFRPIGGRDAEGWIDRRARAIGLKIEPRAVRVLGQLARTYEVQTQNRRQTCVDLWALAVELDKLGAYAAGQTVRESDVRALTVAAREQKGFALADAVAEGRSAQAVKLLHELLDQDVHPGTLLPTIEHRYRQLIAAREMLDEGAGSARIGDALGVRGYPLEKLLEQAERHPMQELRHAFRRLLQADVAIKRGEYEDEVSLELAVHDLADGKNREPST